MQGSGNTPPWKLENKAKYSGFDSKRAQEYFGVKISTPDFFPIMSLLVRLRQSTMGALL
jgi:2-hydroxychromene-2-carboxylate isomerase